MTVLKIQIKSKKYEVNKFLEEMVNAINNEKYIIANREKNNKTFLELNFNTKDILETLRNLSIKDYIYDLPDQVKPEEEMYKVFCKEINKKEIYIKLKMKKMKHKFLFCMSFHVAEHSIKIYPYR